MLAVEGLLNGSGLLCDLASWVSCLFLSLFFLFSPLDFPDLSITSIKALRFRKLPEIRK